MYILIISRWFHSNFLRIWNILKKQFLIYDRICKANIFKTILERNDH